MTSLIRNLARSSPNTILQAGLLSTLVTGDPLGATFTGGAFVLSELLNRLLKFAFVKASPDNDSFKRPSPPPDGCGNYGMAYPKETSGMPSGHSQLVAFTAVFWLLYVHKYSTMSKNGKIASTVLIICLAIGVMISRYTEGCHSVLQILVGDGIGAILGALFFLVLDKQNFFANAKKSR
jgi:membrane-associated phospholipid phosphatase